MATLIVPLAVGFPDAPSGTAELYRRGTSTLSSLVYSDPDGLTAVTTHDLDSAGRVNRYVTERVDLVVKDADGATIATIDDVASVDARTVRMESAAFTGSSLTNPGQIVAGGLTTLHAAFALLATSLDNPDWEINFGGYDFGLRNALISALRDGRYIATTVTGTTYTPDERYRVHIVTHSGATIAFANPTATYSTDEDVDGIPLTIFYTNAAGGNRTPTWGTAYSGAPATAVGNGTTALYEYRRASNIGEWVLVTTAPVTNAS